MKWMKRDLPAVFMFLGFVALVGSLGTTRFALSENLMRVGTVFFLVGGIWIALVMAGRKAQPQGHEDGTPPTTTGKP